MLQRLRIYFKIVDKTEWARISVIKYHYTLSLASQLASESSFSIFFLIDGWRNILIFTNQLAPLFISIFYSIDHDFIEFLVHSIIGFWFPVPNFKGLFCLSFKVRFHSFDHQIDIFSESDCKKLFFFFVWLFAFYLFLHEE